ncbi:MAG: virulence RhuM family protein [Propionibacteriaceae bacterium]|nr:virulence RhuM family protein [Propionibacteriaceae bacterium]
MTEQQGEMIVYRRKGASEVQLRAVNGTVWLSQRALADLYATSVQNIQQTIERILADGEVDRATINSELMVRQEGSRQVRRQVVVYNLDMILAVGYRATTPQAVMFRQWATTVLKEYLVKGFAMDDERLKNPGSEPDYFDEVLQRIREIRTSEKRFYQKVRDLFVATSSDYDKTSQTARDFFATIQNKLLFAVTGRTAAELVRERIDGESLSLGLTTWQGDRPGKADTTIAKNYLHEDEVRTLDRLTTQFLDYAEGQAERRLVTTMAQWGVATDRLIEFNDYPVLETRGALSHRAVEDVVAELWPGFEQARRQREYDEAWQVESSDITELLALEQARMSVVKDSLTTDGEGSVDGD